MDKINDETIKNAFLKTNLRLIQIEVSQGPLTTINFEILFKITLMKKNEDISQFVVIDN